jgi:calcineurin-like phosphoesterase family protein
MSDEAGIMTGMFDFDQFDFVTSDTHFSHARISELAGRPFSSVEEMDEVLLERWNGTVGAEDAILHLGDLALGCIEESLPLTGRLNGRKFLVPGNHDRVSTATQTKKAIERYRPLYEEQGWTILPEILDGTRRGHCLRASHYPYRGDSHDTDRHKGTRPVDDGTPLVHGHTHARTHGSSGRQFHVGVDAFGFMPIPFTLIDWWLGGWK